MCTIDSVFDKGNTILEIKLDFPVKTGGFRSSRYQIAQFMEMEVKDTQGAGPWQTGG